MCLQGRECTLAFQDLCPWKLGTCVYLYAHLAMCCPRVSTTEKGYPKVCSHCPPAPVQRARCAQECIGGWGGGLTEFPLVSLSPVLKRLK